MNTHDLSTLVKVKQVAANTVINIKKELANAGDIMFAVKDSRSAFKGVIEHSRDGVNFEPVDGDSLIITKENIGYTATRPYVRLNMDSTVVYGSLRGGINPDKTLPMVVSATFDSAVTLKLEFDEPVKLRAENIGKLVGIDGTAKEVSIASATVSTDQLDVNVGLGSAVASGDKFTFSLFGNKVMGDDSHLSAHSIDGIEVVNAL